MSFSVRAGLPAQFYSGAHADVRIRFYLERTPEQQQQQQKQQHGEGAEGGRGVASSGLRFVGEPLPAHKVILTLGSSLLQAKLSNPWWQGGAAGGVSTRPQMEDLDVRPAKMMRTSSIFRNLADPSIPVTSDGGQPPSVRNTLPEVLVPLSSEAELPFARQAIEYIYTGSLSSGLGIRALLGVRQQACYLGVKHCPQACDQAMLAVLQAEQWRQQLQQGMYRASTSTGGASARPQFLEAYACRFLFPEPGSSPDAASFQPVRSALAKQLVSHFGDAVAALTRPGLYRQLLQLPAVAVRELLAADDFGTDSEDTVFLLLACWLEVNQGGVSAATRAELCGLLRLHRLTDTYLHHVLPAYWPIAISPTELGFLLRYAGAGEQARSELLKIDSKQRLSPWYCSPARRQVVPEEGRTVEWSISRGQLEQGLREMLESKKVVSVYACFGASAAAVSGGGGSAFSRVLSDGGLWGVKLELDPIVPTAVGIHIKLTVPQQLGRIRGVAALTNIQLAVHSWAQGWRKEGWTRTFACGAVVHAGGGRGWSTALTLLPATANGAGGREGEAAGGVDAEVAAQLTRWSGWLHNGKITGSVTFPEP